MDPQTIIAKRVAQELRPNNLVNLGIGIPTLVANYLAPGLNVFTRIPRSLSSIAHVRAKERNAAFVAE